MANRYWVGGSGNWDTSTTHWSATSGGAGGASVPTSSDSVFFDSGSGTPGTVILIASGSVTGSAPGILNCLDFTISVSGWTFNTYTGGNYYYSDLYVYGNFSVVSGTIYIGYNSSLVFAATSAKTISNNSIFNFNLSATDCKNSDYFTYGYGIVFNGVGGSWTLNSNFNSTGCYTNLINGSLLLNNYTYTTTSWDSSYTSNRSVDFGSSGCIKTTGGSLSGSGLKRSITFDMLTVTNFRRIGTSNVNISMDSLGVTSSNAAQRVVSGTLTVQSQAKDANNLNFLFTGNTQISAVTIATISHIPWANSIIVDTSAGVGFSTAASGSAFQIQGDFVMGSRSTFPTTYGYANISPGTPGVKNITMNGSMGSTTVYFNGDCKLLSDITATSGWLSHTAGTLDLNGKTLYTQQFTCSGTSTAKTLLFNGGIINCYGYSTGSYFLNNDGSFTNTQAGTGMGKICCRTTYTTNIFTGGGIKYAANLEFCTGSSITIADGNNTFNNIVANTSGQLPSISFTPGTTNIVNNFTYSGINSSSRATLKSAAPGGTFTLTCPNPITISISNTNVANSIATGAATWLASTSLGNVDNGLNTGWIFNQYKGYQMMPFFY